MNSIGNLLRPPNGRPTLLEKMSSRNLVETAVKAVLIGRPNAGKSSLFNSLSKKCGALVSPTPGTTRDYLTAELDLDGVKCQLIDTAGIEAHLPTPDGGHHEVVGAGGEGCGEKDIESAAQSAAHEQHQQATIRILCLDAPPTPDDWEREQIEKSDPTSLIAVITKIDENVQDAWWLSDDFSAWTRRLNDSETFDGIEKCLLATSSVTGEGIEPFTQRNCGKKFVLDAAQAEVVAGTAARCRESLTAAEEACDTPGRCSSKTPAKNSSPEKSALPWKNSAASSARFTPTTFWTAFSADFAWGNKKDCLLKRKNNRKERREHKERIFISFFVFSAFFAVNLCE